MVHAQESHVKKYVFIFLNILSGWIFFLISGFAERTRIFQIKE